MTGPIKDLFHRRMKSLKGEIPDYYNYDLDNKIRHKIIGTILDCHFCINAEPAFRRPGYDEFNDFVVSLERTFGRNISVKYDVIDKIQDFMFHCSVDKFLSAIEILVTLKFNNMHRVYYRDHIENYTYKESNKETLSSLINTINEIFKIEKVGYEIIPAGLDKLPFIVVPFNSKYLYLETTKKPMSLMHNEDFKGALNEFEEALDEYRKGEYKDAILKATKSYESTLKTILDLKLPSPSYSNSDNIPKLVDKIKDDAEIIDPNLQTVFDSFWSVIKNGPPNIRNLVGAHGQGLDIKKVEKSYADFVLRLSGTYIVFLIERFQETK